MGDHRHRAAVDPADPGDHTVGGQRVVRGGREQAVFDEGVGVEQHRQPVAHGQLVGPPGRVTTRAGALGGLDDRIDVDPLGPGRVGRSAVGVSVGVSVGAVQPLGLDRHEAMPRVRISSWISSVPPPMRRIRASR